MSFSSNFLGPDDPEWENQLDLVSDFIETMKKECNDQKKKLISTCKARLKLAQRQIPKDERLKLLQPVRKMIGKENESSSIDDDFIDERLSSIKTTVKKKTASQRKKACPSTVRRSVRQTSGMCTPMTNTLPNKHGRNIFITPKINPMTPLNRTVHRQPKPNEMLFSMSGSPVSAVMLKGKQKEKSRNQDDFAAIRLDSDVTLNLPFLSEFQHSGLDLDEDQLDKLSKLKEGISNMLKERIGTSESE